MTRVRSARSRAWDVPAAAAGMLLAGAVWLACWGAGAAQASAFDAGTEAGGDPPAAADDAAAGVVGSGAAGDAAASGDGASGAADDAAAGSDPVAGNGGGGGDAVDAQSAGDGAGVSSAHVDGAASNLAAGPWLAAFGDAALDRARQAADATLAARAQMAASLTAGTLAALAVALAAAGAACFAVANVRRPRIAGSAGRVRAVPRSRVR